MYLAHSSPSTARTSNTVTSQRPLSSSCDTRWRPTKPEPPVTRHRRLVAGLRRGLVHTMALELGLPLIT